MSRSRLITSFQSHRWNWFEIKFSSFSLTPYIIINAAKEWRLTYFARPLWPSWGGREKVSVWLLQQPSQSCLCSRRFCFASLSFRFRPRFFGGSWFWECRKWDWALVSVAASEVSAALSSWNFLLSLAVFESPAENPSFLLFLQTITSALNKRIMFSSFLLHCCIRLLILVQQNNGTQLNCCHVHIILSSFDQYA